MRYLSASGTDTFQALSDLKSRMDACNRAADDFVHELGAEYRQVPYFVLAGGIRGFGFDATQSPPDPARWVKNHRHPIEPQTYYRLRKAGNKDAFARWQALPTMEYEELHPIINWQEVDRDAERTDEEWAQLKDDTRPELTPPQIFLGETFHLLMVDEEADYVPFVDMHEILISDFNARKKKLQAAVINRSTPISGDVLRQLGFRRFEGSFHFDGFSNPYIKPDHISGTLFTLQRADDSPISEVKNAGQLSDLWFALMDHRLLHDTRKNT